MERLVSRAMVVVVAVGLTACGGDDPASPDVGTGSVTATVDGSAWTASFIQAINNSGVVGVGASGPSGITIGFGFVNAGPGSYDVTTSSGASGTVSEGIGNVWTANSGFGSGTIVVTSIDTNGMSGTFSFTAALSAGTGAATRSVTNGSFDVSF